jgi:NAD(P)-dependent dehydrogenase (short-subunit alcohol dehydrogenase family)
MPVDCPKPPYPSQKQPMPESTAKMDPRPDHGETSYKGSGRLKGMKAVITGGDSGIGRAVAIAYAREGADVLIAYLDEDDDANEVKDLIEKEGRRAVLVSGDLQNADHCRAVIRKAVDKLGTIDILVNNAAHQATFKDIGDISDEEWELTFKVNIHAMFYLAKAAIPHMKPGSAVDRSKQALGEWGPVWWQDGAPDLNRQMAKNTPYAAWYTREVQGGRA